MIATLLNALQALQVAKAKVELKKKEHEAVLARMPRRISELQIELDELDRKAQEIVTQIAESQKPEVKKEVEKAEAGLDILKSDRKSK